MEKLYLPQPRTFFFSVHMYSSVLYHYTYEAATNALVPSKTGRTTKVHTAKHDKREDKEGMY